MEETSSRINSTTCSNGAWGCLWGYGSFWIDRQLQRQFYWGDPAFHGNYCPQVCRSMWRHARVTAIVNVPWMAGDFSKIQFSIEVARKGISTGSSALNPFSDAINVPTPFLRYVKIGDDWATILNRSLSYETVCWAGFQNSVSMELEHHSWKVCDSNHQ